MNSPTTLPPSERRRPALVVAFTMPQLALLTVAAVLLGVGLIFWMTTIARYQMLAVEKLEAVRDQSALLRETIAAHVRVVERDSTDLLFYTQRVCEQIAQLGKQQPQICRPDRPNNVVVDKDK